MDAMSKEQEPAEKQKICLYQMIDYQKDAFPWPPDPFGQRWRFLIRELLFLLLDLWLGQRLLFVFPLLHSNWLTSKILFNIFEKLVKTNPKGLEIARIVLKSSILEFESQIVIKTCLLFSNSIESLIHQNNQMVASILYVIKLNFELKLFVIIEIGYNKLTVRNNCVKPRNSTGVLQGISPFFCKQASQVCIEKKNKTEGMNFQGNKYILEGNLNHFFLEFMRNSNQTTIINIQPSNSKCQKETGESTAKRTPRSMQNTRRSTKKSWHKSGSAESVIASTKTPMPIVFNVIWASTTMPMSICICSWPVTTPTKKFTILPSIRNQVRTQQASIQMRANAKASMSPWIQKSTGWRAYSRTSEALLQIFYIILY